jgi:predicted porin
MNKPTLAAATLALALASVAHAQTSGVTIYGSLDQYLNYMHSNSGATVKSLEDGAFLRSRIGFRGTEDLGDGYAAKFQLEGGFSADAGTQADATRFFDRQTWVGLSAPYAEVRFGRQNGPIFYRGCNIDYTCRTLGSMVNAFGTPSRYDNAFTVITTRKYGVLLEAQVSLPESPVGNHPIVYQVGLDWKNDSFAVGYAGLRGRPPTNAAIDKDVVYDNVFGNWTFGNGTVYLTYVRSNNSTSNATSNNAGTILGNVGGFNAGTNTDLDNFYRIYQISADYRVADLLRLGALWGKIDDKSGRNRGATGGSIGAYYDLSKRTTLMALVDTLRNDTNGGWRPAGSAGLKTTFTAPGDINGRTINGVQLGIIHRF